MTPIGNDVIQPAVSGSNDVLPSAVTGRSSVIVQQPGSDVVQHLGSDEADGYNIDESMKPGFDVTQPGPSHYAVTRPKTPESLTSASTSDLDYREISRYETNVSTYIYGSSNRKL